jgi:LmbE family N-acetylglucosaminyl deacetylase
MHHFAPELSPLAEPTCLPFGSLTAVDQPILIVAPHPDDETLGCGGAITLLRSLGCRVRVLVISDGTKSHPNSRRYPPARLRAVREAETLAAMALLGLDQTQVTFLRFPDGDIPRQDTLNINQAISICQAYLTEYVPKTIFLPYRFDPHPDHQATWQLIHQSLVCLPESPRLIEYPIWDWDPEQRHDLPVNQFSAWRLDIADVLLLKQQAIALYKSQTTNLIDDDPAGFCLTPELLANFTQPWELYFEQT